MPVAVIETEYGAVTLMQKLSDAGFVVHSHDSHLSTFQVQWREPDLPLLLDTLTQFVFLNWCYEYVCDRVGVLHEYLTDDEREYVALLAFHSLRRASDPIGGLTVDDWSGIVRTAFGDILCTAGNAGLIRVNVSGVIRFRAKDYLAAIDECIHELVEQFLADREYEEFVAMLRYILETQPSSQQVIHLYCSDDNVWLSDAEGVPVRDPVVTAVVTRASEGEEINAEDLAMSILIMRSPRQIVIHDLAVAAPWPSFAETVERVFLDRAVRCPGCAACANPKPTRDSREPQPPTRSVIPDE